MYSTPDELTTKINELQSDILGEKLTNNPLMKASKIASKTKALDTKSKTIVTAINELLKGFDNLESVTLDSMNSMYSVLGNFGSDPELINELTSRGAETILALAANNYDTIQEIRDFAKDDYEDVFHVAEGQTQSEFVLTHKPIGKIRMYIDGIRYFKECIEYNADTNTVKWVNDSSNPEGFDITDADVVFEYDYKIPKEEEV